MTESQEKQIRNMVASHARVRITARRRSKSGFVVVGPDGTEYHAPTFAEAGSNLIARVCVYNPPVAWEIKVKR